jgi:hypothetical protein
MGGGFSNGSWLSCSLLALIAHSSPQNLLTCHLIYHFILAILERWTNHKMDRGESLLIPMTMPQWIEALYGLYSYNVIADSLEELTEEGLISREKFKTNRPGKDQYRYLLNYREISARLQTLTFPGLPAQQSIINQGSSLTNQDFTVRNEGLASSQTFKSQGCIEGQNNNIESSTEEDSRLSTSTHPSWSVWRKSINRKADAPPNERDLKYCDELEAICRQAQVELTVSIIHEVKDWFRNKYPNKSGWYLGNLASELQNYLDQLPPGTPIEPELPELTEEEAEQQVLWTDHPDGAYALIGTIEQMTQAGILKRMLRSEARAHDYDIPGAYRFTPEEEAEYDTVQSLLAHQQLTSQSA